MRILKVTFFIFLVVLLIGCLTFFEKEKIILPHIEMFIEGRGVPSTSQIEISPDGKLLVIYGGYIKADWPTVNAANYDAVNGILYVHKDGRKEKRYLTGAESKEILKMVETVKNECEIGDGGMADGTVAHVYIDGIQYACWFWWERWGYNMELRPLAYYLVNLSRMEEMDYYKEYIPEDFFENV